MASIRELMTEDHRHCDDLLAAAEEAVGAKKLEAAVQALAAFQQAMLAHFDSEEQILFPSFEAATGMVQGPTKIMRMEHMQIRQLIEEAVEALANADVETYLGQVDTLVVMMQQHNLKEENILYPMCDQHLMHEADEIVTQLTTGLMPV